MSPEQSLADRNLDGRSDLYSLGCVLYEMLAGEAPYTGATAQAIVAKRLREPVPHVSTVRESVPAGVEQALERVLAKAPADRFATAEEFAQALAGDTSTPGAVTPVAVTPAGAPPTAPARGERGWRRTVAPALVLVAALVAVGLFAWPRLRAAQGGAATTASPPAPPVPPASAPAPAQPSLAVLPFDNLSGERDNEYFSDGMTEELITALGRVPGLRVAARASSFAFKGKPLDVQDVSRKLNVGAVLDGSVRRSGRRLRVTAELVDARDGARVWADSYDRELRDVFHVQDELARAIVEALRVPLKVGAGPAAALVRNATADPRAHDLYLRGRFLWNQRTAKSLGQAADYFREAVALDSGYAEAYAGLADVYAVLPQYDAIVPGDAILQATRAAERALALDSTLAGAHAALALVRGYQFDWQGAETEYQRAIALNPSYAPAHQWYALHLATLGHSEEALAEIEKARALDPLSLIIATNTGSVLAFNRRYDDAIRQLRGTLELAPDYFGALAWLCLTNIIKRDFAAAIPVCGRGSELSNGTFGLSFVAWAHAGTGDRTLAEATMEELRAVGRRGYVAPLEFAMGHTGLGNLDSAFKWLDSAYAVNDPNLSEQISSPLMDPLRPDPRYGRLRERMGLPP
jgi:TolB-like protein/Tfp pilus assembly protein PilF